MKTDNTSEGRNKIPENDPSKAMDSKKEVERSNDEKTDQDFPGYPHYPAREDIMDKRNDYTKENIDVEKNNLLWLMLSALITQVIVASSPDRFSILMRRVELQAQRSIILAANP